MREMEATDFAVWIPVTDAQKPGLDHPDFDCSTL